jgi:hypothetical protein
MTNDTPGRVWLVTGCSTGFGLLGDDAVDGLREHHEVLLAEVSTGEELSRSTAV